MNMRKREKKNKRKVTITITSFVCLLILMTVGYAAFSTNITITAKGNIVEDDSVDITANVVTSGDGLYEDSYETTCTRYVYRGSDPDNYIEFNGEVWRIISKECDGTYKILRNSVLYEMEYDEYGYRDALSSGNGGTYCAFSTSSYGGCNVWAATESFSSGNYSGTVDLDSSLNKHLNGEYSDSLSPTAQSYIVSHSFNIGAVSVGATFTENLTEEKAYKWNGYVGLISVTDYLNANSNQATCSSIANNEANYQTCGSTNWMYIDSTGWWTLSPTVNNTYEVFFVDESGTINSTNVIDPYGVRPVVHLSSSITLTGEGTSSDPYTIVG